MNELKGELQSPAGALFLWRAVISRVSLETKVPRVQGLCLSASVHTLPWGLRSLPRSVLFLLHFTFLLWGCKSAPARRPTWAIAHAVALVSVSNYAVMQHYCSVNGAPEPAVLKLVNSSRVRTPPSCSGNFSKSVDLPLKVMSEQLRRSGDSLGISWFLSLSKQALKYSTMEQK